MSETLIAVRPLETRKNVLVDIYDDGSEAISMGVGKKPFMLLTDVNFGRDFDRRTVDTTHPGIRPRWGRVLATTNHAENLGIVVGDKVLLDTMKWTRGVVYDNAGRKLWSIEAVDVLMVDDEGFTEEELDTIKNRWDKNK